MQPSFRLLGIILFSGFLAAYFSHKWDD
ncbi:protein MgtS [Escherichia coli]